MCPGDHALDYVRVSLRVCISISYYLLSHTLSHCQFALIVRPSVSLYVSLLSQSVSLSVCVYLYVLGITRWILFASVCVHCPVTSPLLSRSLSLSLSLSQSVCVSVCQSVCVSVCQSVFKSVCLCVCVCVCERESE